MKSMTAKLAHHSYGKTSIRLTKVTRRPDRHDLAEFLVNIHLDGDFARSYSHGDNRHVYATGSVKDQYTTLPETTDRILATKVAANWFFNSPKPNYNAAFLKIRIALLETFARHKSDAVQQTLLAMGEAALKAEKSIERIYIHMPNK